MRSYVTKKKNHLTDDEYLERELVRYWILFAANIGLRSGEQRQLKWLDVSIEVEGGGNVQEIKLAKILVRKETSKVRMPRTLYCRGGDYIERWSKLLRQYGKSADGYVFSVQGDKVFPRTNFHRHWKLTCRVASISPEIVHISAKPNGPVRMPTEQDFCSADCKWIVEVFDHQLASINT